MKGIAGDSKQIAYNNNACVYVRKYQIFKDKNSISLNVSGYTNLLLNMQ